MAALDRFHCTLVILFTGAAVHCYTDGGSFCEGIYIVVTQESTMVHFS